MSSLVENWTVDNNTEEKDEPDNFAPNEEMEHVVPGYTNFEDYVKEGFNSMRNGIKAANSLPNGENFKYYSCFPRFQNIRNGEIKKILKSMQNILDLIGVKGSIDRQEAEEKFDLLVEANDVLLDRADLCMDEASGINRNPSVELVVTQTKACSSIGGSWNASSSTLHNSQTDPANQAVRLLGARNVQRPQLFFKDKIDNSSKPWEPRIKDKPNSLKPLAIYLEEGELGEVFNHPYEFELDKFQPSEAQLQKCEPIKYKSLEGTPLLMVETLESLKILLEDLKDCKEIAVDLEHHSYRSFLGITCLMQISTRDKDYIVDTLTLRSELHQLNDIFTKPTVLKVFHGADSDIQWLQRDLSLYVVNMFDTHQAAKLLNLPYLSLAYLLKRYCGLDPNKQFQLADWRIRPLPDELMKYAREDTHYLLYIKDILINALIELANGECNLAKAAYARSTEVCKRTYAKPIWTEESYKSIYRKSDKMFNNRQLYALKEISLWRDTTARQEDDSTGYVLPNHMLLNIAETLPREMQGILACCNPIPPLVRQNLLKLHKIILKARDQPLLKPILEEDIRHRSTQRDQALDPQGWTCIPHDIPTGTEVRANLPCLLDMERMQEKVESVTLDHSVTIFDSPPLPEDEEDCASKKAFRKKTKFMFVSPFERYKRVLPMVAAEEAKERERKDKEEAARQQKVKQDEEDTKRSKDRVLEHFKQVSQVVSKQNNKIMPLGQMPDRKRKRESNLKDDDSESQSHFQTDLSNPVPSLGVMQPFKRRNISEDHDDRQRYTRKLHQSQKNEPHKCEEIKSIRIPMKKGDKKATKQELQQQGRLPAEKFNYKSVDFSSFQGGSFANLSTSSKFEQKKEKNKIKKGNPKRKKQKWNGR